MEGHSRGGHHQKRARRAAERVEGGRVASSLRGKLKDSPLAEALVLRWADGNLSALDVQDIAACAVASGATDGQVHYLASLGSAGSSMGGNASN